MKFYMLLLFITAAYSAPNPINEQTSFALKSGRGLSESLRDALEKFRIVMREGDAENNIPVMDPLDIDAYKFDFDTGMLSMDIASENIVFKGLSDFIVHNIDLNMIRLILKFDITLPLTTMQAEKYNFTGKVFEALPIYGKGAAHFEVGNFYITGSSKIAVGLNGVYLRDLDVKLFVDSLHSETSGMLGGGDIDNVINAMMADMAPEFFNKNSPMISEAMSSFVLTMANEALDGMSLSDLIDLILG